MTTTQNLRSGSRVRFFGTTWTVRNPRTCEDPACSRPVCDLEPEDPGNREQHAVHCDELTSLG